MHARARRANLVACLSLFCLTACGCIDDTSKNARISIFARQRQGSDRIFEIAIPASKTPASVDLSAAINETVCFQLIVRSETTIKSPQIWTSNLTSPSGQIEASAAQIFRMCAVDVFPRWPGWHIRSVSPDRRRVKSMDVLVPIDAPENGQPKEFLAGQVYRYWVEINVPKGTPADRYSGSVAIVDEDGRLDEMDIRLTVYPFVLPDEISFPILGALDHRALFRHHVRIQEQPFELGMDHWHDLPIRQRLDNLLFDTMRLLHEHGITPILPNFKPLARVNADGQLDVDWEMFNAVASPVLTGEAFENRIPMQAWSLPVSQFLKPLIAENPAATRDSARLLRTFLCGCGEHFATLGLLDSVYTHGPGARTPRAGSVHLTRRLAEILDGCDYRIKLASPLFPQDLTSLGWSGFHHEDFRQSVDIWMPVAQFFDAETMRKERLAGRDTWLTVDRPPFSGTTHFLANPSDTRVLSWQVLGLGAQALHLGVINDWPLDGERSEANAIIAASSSALLYPGTPFGLNHPVPSVRLKQVRRTMQDAAYLELLKEHNLGFIAETLMLAISPRAGAACYRTHYADGRAPSWPADEDAFEAARRIMANAIVDKVQRTPTAPNPFEHNALWRRFMLSTRKLRVETDGVRMRCEGTPTNLSARIECHLTLENRRRVPIRGTISLVDLPQGWTTEQAGRQAIAIPPNDSRIVSLDATTTSLMTDAAGTVMLPIKITTDAGETVETAIRFSLITAVTAQSPPTIDGALSEWPAGISNVASDFILITGEPTDPADDSQSRPANQTTVYVMRDEEFLYIGFNCEQPSSPEGVLAGDNQIEYEDLIPVGEEMIEVLIDPLNGGTRTPADLYHIAIKQSGVVLCERGLKLEPPCGKRTPWPIDIRAATRTYNGRWITEMAIPLAAFGESAKDNHAWGINFTRFDLSEQEFSTWSGACRNAYDPLTLGNLFLPR